MLVKPISAPPAGASTVPVRFDVSLDEVLAESQTGVPVACVGTSVLLSAEELHAALFTVFVCDSDLDDLTDAEVRQAVAFSVVWDGMRAIHRSADRIASGVLDADSRRFAERCRRLVCAAFGMESAR